MKNYEMMYIVNIDNDEEARQAIHDNVTKLLENNNVTIDETDHLGVKRFAYEINHQNEGDYMVVKFTADADVISTLNEELNMNENLVRHMIFAIDE